MVCAPSSMGTATYIHKLLHTIGQQGQGVQSLTLPDLEREAMRRPVLSRRRLLSKNCTCRIHSSIQRKERHPLSRAGSKSNDKVTRSHKGVVELAFQMMSVAYS